MSDKICSRCGGVMAGIEELIGEPQLKILNECVCCKDHPILMGNSEPWTPTFVDDTLNDYTRTKEDIGG